MKKTKKLTPYLFILPHYLMFVIFFLIPVIYGLFISFCKWDFISPPVFVGFGNYRDFLFNKDSYFYGLFWNSLKNTFLYVIVSVPLLVVIPLCLAAAIRNTGKLASFFQSVFYFPSLLSVATVVLTWRWMLDRTLGVINRVFHIDVGWTSDQPWFWVAVVILSIWWGLGGNMVIFIAGIADIAQELYEASDIDGANFFQKFIFITLPGLKNQLLYTVVMTTIASFNIYGQPVMLAASSSLSDDKNVLMAAIQSTAFGGSQIAGMASAMSMILGGIIMVISIVQMHFSGERNKKNEKA